MDGVEQRASHRGIPKRASASWIPGGVSDLFHRFVRQEVTAFFSPVPSIFYSAMFFFVLTVVTIPVGAALFWQALENTEVILRYDNFQLMNGTLLSNRQRREIIMNDTVPVIMNYSMIVPETLDSPVHLHPYASLME